MKGGPEVEKHLAGISPDLRKVVDQLRKTIFETIPDVRESIKWRNLAYEKKGMVGMIIVHKDHVNLQLWYGSRLSDPNKILEGTGKNARHVRIRTRMEAKKSELRELLRQAGNLVS